MEYTLEAFINGNKNKQNGRQWTNLNKLQLGLDLDDHDSQSADEQSVGDHEEVEETLVYALTMQMFNNAVQRVHELEKAMDEIIYAEGWMGLVSEQDKNKSLAATRQLIASLELSSQKELEGEIRELQLPLSAEEAEILASTTQEDWKRLNEGKSSKATKHELEARVKLLLREFNENARKEKMRKGAREVSKYLSEPVEIVDIPRPDLEGKKICRHCQTGYTAVTSLHQHLKSESGVRFFFCSTCEGTDKKSSFTRKNSLYYHILKENGIPRYICEDCNKAHNHTHHHKCHSKKHRGSTRNNVASGSQEKSSKSFIGKGGQKRKHSSIEVSQLKNIKTELDEQILQENLPPFAFMPHRGYISVPYRGSSSRVLQEIVNTPVTETNILPPPGNLSNFEQLLLVTSADMSKLYSN